MGTHRAGEEGARMPASSMPPGRLPGKHMTGPSFV